jgi:hypothetical protein
MAKKKDETVKDSFEFGAEVEDETIVAASDNAIDEGEISLELTEAEKTKLRAEARKEVAAALKLSKMKEFKAAEKKRIQAQAMFANGKDDSGEDLVTVELQLASYPKYIILDGARYYSGRKYTKRRAVAAVLLDQMDRGWRQEFARRGEKNEFLESMPKRLSHSSVMAH